MAISPWHSQGSLTRRRLPVSASGSSARLLYENVSEEAWNQFLEHVKMVVNEYRLNLMDESTDAIFNKTLEDFLFGDGAALPEGYTPPQTKG